MIISADGKKKKTLPVNQKASFLASAECGEKIHGNAVITDAPGDEICGFTLEDEEKIVDMFAKGIYQVLQDNARALYDIKE